MKYTNGKKADATAFPFKAVASPAKGLFGGIFGGGGGGGSSKRNRDGSDDWKDDLGGAFKGGLGGGWLRRMKEKMKQRTNKEAEAKVEEVIDMGDEGTGDGLV